MIVESRYQRTLGGGSPKATIRINMKTLLILIISKHIKGVPEKIRSVKHGNLVDSYTFFGRTPCFPQHIYLLPPVATHWMVKGSPSLNGPTGREFDNCLPRSPRIRGVEGGTEIIILKKWHMTICIEVMICSCSKFKVDHILGVL